MIDRYLIYIASVRRYSLRTQQIYRSVLDSFAAFCQTPDQVGGDEKGGAVVGGDGYSVMPGSDRASVNWPDELNVQQIRAYEVELLNRGESARTVHLHLSGLSGFCRFSDLRNFR